MKLNLLIISSWLAFSLSSTNAQETESKSWTGKHGSEVHLETTKGTTSGSYHLDATGPKGKSIESQGTAKLTKDGVKINTETQNAQGQTSNFDGNLKKDGDTFHLSGQHNGADGRSRVPSERRPSSFSRQKKQHQRIPMARPSGPSRRGRR